MRIEQLLEPPSSCNLSKPLIKSPGPSRYSRDFIYPLLLAGVLFIELRLADVWKTLDWEVHVRKARIQTAKTLPAGPVRDPYLTPSIEHSPEHLLEKVGAMITPTRTVGTQFHDNENL